MKKLVLRRAGLATVVPIAALLILLSFSARADSNPFIDVWYGSTQDFGRLGLPQVWVNILGNVSDPDGVDTLTYSLNGGPPCTLTVGPDNRRLESAGDFNADIAYDDLEDGTNQVVLTATDSLGNATIETVTVTYHTGNTRSLPCSVDWSSVANTQSIQDVAQVIDGLWNVESDRLRTLEPGYHRLIAIGDVSWTDYEVTVPVTIHTTEGDGGAGILMRWNGHTDVPIPGTQPKSGWLPRGALGWYVRSGSDAAAHLEIRGNGNLDIIARDDSRIPIAGVQYIFKMRVETIPDHGGLYSLKVWESSQPEPAGWDLTGQEELTDPQEGSMMLVAHRWDTSFGDVTITRVSNADITLTTNTVGSGAVDKQPDQSVYAYGQVVTLTAQPDAGWVFDRWSGDLVTTTNPTSVTMTSSQVITAYFSDTDDAPTIQVVKDGPTSASVGDTVVYTFTVTNDDMTGDGSAIGSVTVDDNVARTPTYVGGDDGDGLLEVGESWVHTASYTILPDDPDPLVNTATASGEDRDGDPVSDADSHSLDVAFASALSVTKNGPDTAAVGDTAVYTFTLTNDDTTGDGSPVDSIAVDDDVVGTPTYVGGDDGDAQLEVGESWIYTASYTIQLDDPDPLVNTVIASGEDRDGHMVSSIDGHRVDLGYTPVIRVVKGGPGYAHVGDTIVYTFTVTNDHAAGDGSVISAVSVDDDVTGTPIYVRGDDDDQLLEVGESWVYTASYTIQSDDPDPLVNTVTVSGHDLNGEPGPQGSDNHSLDVEYAPALGVVKDGPVSANVGDTVVYTFAVANDNTIGDGSPIDNVTVDDDVAGTPAYVSGDDGDDLLEVGESWVYTASYTIQSDDSDPLVNTATASGLDLESNAIYDTASHSTVLTDYSIFLPLVTSDASGVRDAAGTLELAFWDVYYKHSSNLSPGLLERPFRRGGFDLLDVARACNSRHLVMETWRGTRAGLGSGGREESVQDLIQDVKHFSESCRHKLEVWRRNLLKSK